MTHPPKVCRCPCLDPQSLQPRPSPQPSRYLQTEPFCGLGRVASAGGLNASDQHPSQPAQVCLTMPSPAIPALRHENLEHFAFVIHLCVPRTSSASDRLKESPNVRAQCLHCSASSWPSWPRHSSRRAGHGAQSRRLNLFRLREIRHSYRQNGKRTCCAVGVVTT
jgi:hypothetical protein